MAFEAQRGDQAAMTVKHALGICIAATLVACSSVPPPPDWQVASAASMRQAVQAYLSGNDRIAQSAQARAEREVRRTASIDALARVQLMQCAAQVAAAQVSPCGPATAWADASPETQAYADYLAAAILSPQQMESLPRQQRTAAAASKSQSAAALLDMKDSWSRLVAAGIMWRTQRISPEAIGIAVDTAAQEGWTRALGHWLQIQRDAYKVAGKSREADRIQLRIDVLMGR